LFLSFSCTLWDAPCNANATFKLENNPPYARAGATSSVWESWTPAVGNHSVTAVPYSLANASGSAGTGLTIRFTCVDDATAPSVKALAAEETLPAEEAAALETGTGSGGSSCGLLGLEAAVIVAYFALRPRSSRASA
jgi:hypothetical protein